METPDIVIEILGWMLILSPWVVIPSWFLKRWALQGIGGKWGVRGAWLVWIPVVHFGIPGAISDRYRVTMKGKKKSHRKIWLPLLRLAWIVLWIPAIGILTDGYMQHEEIVSIGASEIAANLMFGYAILDALVFILPALILGLTELILRYMALYDFYAACAPKRRVWYLLLSLIPVVNLITQPVLLLLCRSAAQPEEVG